MADLQTPREAVCHAIDDVRRATCRHERYQAGQYLALCWRDPVLVTKRPRLELRTGIADRIAV